MRAVWGQTNYEVRMPESHSSIDYLLSDDLAPLFWTPKRIALSAWQGHVPFAHWLVHVARPGTFVELGTYSGVSYSAFRGAVEKTGSDTHCLAVDTWKGDKHSGFHDEEIFTEFRTFHDEISARSRATSCSSRRLL